ncbi:MAG: phosphoenolpyruvate--protein phosphotransferase [Acholeplasmataceae bacterium]|nr:phosphoenolpyruvate--protein phosphotransferase [Acholeplasmataceae bacterium]
MQFKGIAINHGIAISEAMKLETIKIDTSRKTIDDPIEEVRRFRVAVHKSEEQLSRLIQSAKETFDEDTARIFEAQKMIAADIEANAMVETLINSEHVTATHAIDVVKDQYIARFEMIDDPYLRERISDIKDVTMRTLKNFLDQTIVDFASFKEHVIIVAEDINASEMVRIDPRYIRGIVLAKGGKTSHSAIIARLLGIPAVFGIKDVLSYVASGDTLVIDGSDGDVLVEPDQDVIDLYEAKILDLTSEISSLEVFRGEPTLTKDQTLVKLSANIQSESDLASVIDGDAEGIGLFRTEFLYVNRAQPPTEDEQMDAYVRVLKAMKGKPVVIRTIDIGGDKPLSYLSQPNETNPFLGKRALRLCYDHKEVFQTQLRALYRASVVGDMSIMFPMVTTLQDVLWAKDIAKGVMDDLAKEGITYKTDVPLGVMIEVPSSALIADVIAKHVDFFSIGTNDLIQYTFAADRTNEDLSYLYQPLHPAILKLIQMVTDAALKHRIPVSVCGEMASDHLCAPMLLALGVTSLSMVPSYILPMRKALHETNLNPIRKQLIDVFSSFSEEQVIAILTSIQEGEQS